MRPRETVNEGIYRAKMEFDNDIGAWLGIHAAIFWPLGWVIYGRFR
jgi:hypothetical protein